MRADWHRTDQPTVYSAPAYGMEPPTVAPDDRPLPHPAWTVERVGEGTAARFIATRLD